MNQLTNREINRGTAQWLRDQRKPVPSVETDPKGWDAAKRAFLKAQKAKAASVKRVGNEQVVVTTRKTRTISKATQATHMAQALAPDGLRVKAGIAAAKLVKSDGRISAKTAATRAVAELTA